MLQYTSSVNRPVLGRWSYQFTALLLATAALLVLAAARSWRGLRESKTGQGVPVGTSLVDLAVLCWGAAYLTGALDAPENGSRLLDANLFGSVPPAAALLEWVSLVLLFLATARRVARRIPARWKDSALLLGTLGALYLAGEGAARVRTAIAPEVVAFPTCSLKAWLRRYVRLNSLGFRDGEHALAAPDHVRRLLLIGDSFAFGWGIPRVGDRFGEQLGARLTAATGEPWEILNFSRPDTHTLHHLGFLHRGLVYRPDVVILLYVFNDIDYLAAARGFVPVVERNIISEHPHTLAERLHPLRLVYWNSYVFQELYVRVPLIRQRREEDRGGAAPDPYADSATVARHLVDLSRFVALARDAGATVAIVPFDPAVASAPPARRRYDHFVATAVAAGLPVWSAAGAFAGYTSSALTINRRDGHPNPLADRLAAREVCVRLEATLGAPTGPCTP
jgi:hypothetical protein